MRSVVVTVGVGVLLTLAVRSRDWIAGGPGGQWVAVVRDSTHHVAIDTSRLRGRPDGPRQFGDLRQPSVEVWFRTEHTHPRLHEGQQFDRELVRSIVHCDSLWFKVISVDLSLGGRPPISEQRSSIEDVRRQPWRKVARGTSDEVAAEAACRFGFGARR